MRKLAQTRWWIITCLEILAISIGIFFGLHDILVASDQTKLSFVIAALWAVSTIFIGRCHFYRDSGYIRDSAKIGWFLAETCLALGMLGTVMGFLLMLGTAFAGIDVANISSVQSALNEMAVGMSTALWTTFMGLAASLFIKVQLVNLEHLADRNGQQ